jgi:hypothetical protein
LQTIDDEWINASGTMRQTNGVGGTMMTAPDQGKLTMMEFALLYYRQSPQNTTLDTSQTTNRKSK